MSEDNILLFDWKHLRDVTRDILRGAGSDAPEAEVVAERLIKANLTGHDSHGIIRIPRYMMWLRDGMIVPNQHTDIIRDNGATVLLSGHRGYGQVAATETVELAIERARTHQIAAVGVTDLAHIGRLADYCLMGAEAGMVTMLFTSTGGYSKLVAPYGGSDRRMSTNPIAAAFPSDREHPVVFDLATSAYAEGKFRVMVEGKVPAPDGVLFDPEGNPSNDPEDLYRLGAIMPLGGAQGYKGYLLNFLVEVLGGLLTGGGFVGKETDPPFNNCTMMLLLNVTAFRELPAFKEELNAFIDFLKQSRPDATGGVMYPGEKEVKYEAKRTADGVPLAATTVANLQGEMDRYGVSGDLASSGTPSNEPAWQY